MQYNFEPAYLDEIGDVIDAPIHLNGGWSANGQNPAADDLPLGDAVYGSWSGKDAKVGEMVVDPFILPDTLLIPLVTVPRFEGLKIAITDASTGTLLETYVLPKTTKWQIFTFNLPTEILGKTVNVTMSYLGSN